ETGHGVHSFFWSQDSRAIFYTHDHDGDENDHIHAVDLDSSRTLDLTPWPEVKAAAIATSWRHPGEVLVEANRRDRRLMDVWRIDSRTGSAQLDEENPGDVSAWIPDQNLVVRAALATTPDGGSELRVRDSAGSPWRVLIKAEPGDSIAPFEFR